jgi:hypothetical protein
MFQNNQTKNQNQSFFDFKPGPIQIVIYTNAASKSPVTFTRSMLDTTGMELGDTLNLTEDYPLFSDKHKLPAQYLNSAKFSQRMQFFFNKDMFNQVMNQYNPMLGKEKKAADKNVFAKRVDALRTSKATDAEKKRLENAKVLKTTFDDAYSKVDTFMTRFFANASLPPPSVIQTIQKIQNNKQNITGAIATREQSKNALSTAEDTLSKRPDKDDPYNTVDPALQTLRKDIEHAKKNILDRNADLKKYNEELVTYYDELARDALNDVDKLTNDKQKQDLILAVEKFKQAYSAYRPQLLQEIQTPTVGGGSNTQDQAQIGGIAFTEVDQTTIRAKNALISSNVQLMLTCLFPTKYPSRNSYSSSWETKINHGTTIESLGSFGLGTDIGSIGTMVSRVFGRFTDEHYSEKYPDFSYLKIDGKKCTVIDVIWISDIYNHKTYSKLLDSYNKLKEVNSTKKDKLTEENENKKQAFRNKQKTFDYNKNISSGGNQNNPLLQNLQYQIIPNLTDADFTDIGDAYYIKDTFLKKLESLKSTPSTSTSTSTSTSPSQQLLNIINNIKGIEQMSILEYFIFRTIFRIKLLEISNRSRGQLQTELKDQIDKLRKVKDMLYDVKTRMTEVFDILNTPNSDFARIYLLFEYVKESIEKLNSYSSVIRIQPEETKLLEKIKLMISEIQPIQQNDYLLRKYLGQDINFNFLQDPKISSESKSQYKEYGDFINLLNTFSKSTRESSNSFLQKTIEEFIYRLGDDITFMMNPESLYSKDLQEEINNYLERFHTGVSILAGPRYEIEVYIGAIEGEVTNKTVGEIDCAYRGEKLTDTAISLTTPKMKIWELNELAELDRRRRIFDAVGNKWVITGASSSTTSAPQNPNPVGEKAALNINPISNTPISQTLEQKQMSDQKQGQSNILAPQGGGNPVSDKKNPSINPVSDKKSTRKLKTMFLKYTIKKRF